MNLGDLIQDDREEDGASYFLAGSPVPAQEGEKSLCEEYMEIELQGGGMEVSRRYIPISE